MENWYLPITIIPGIGLLILSTSNLMVALSNEINSLLNEGSQSETIIGRKLSQLKLLTTTMVLFYIAISCLVIAGLLGGISQNFDITLGVSLYAFMIGIVILLIGLFSLIRYSYRAVSIRQQQFKITINKK